MRFTNPNLSTLKLIEVDFIGLDEVAADVERLGAILAELGTLDREARKGIVHTLLEAMLEGLAVGSESLDPAALDMIAQRSRSLLRPPWSIDDKESTREWTALYLKVPGRRAIGLREESMILRAGPAPASRSC